MTTEAKKLQTTLTEAGNLDCNADSPAQRDSNVRHDARPAHELLAENGQLVSRIHEMLPVIRQLDFALRMLVTHFDINCPCRGCRVLVSAAPFLDRED